MNHRFSDILPVLRDNMDYLGFKDIEIYESRDTVGVGVFFSTRKYIQPHVLAKNPGMAIKEVCGQLFEDLHNSQYIADLKASHEKEMQSYKDQIETLQKTNMELSEAFTNGLEYLEERK